MPLDTVTLSPHPKLYWRWEDTPGGGANKRLKLVLPSKLADHVLTCLHMGLRKTLKKVRSHFYWVGQRRDVDTWCNNCNKCWSRKSPNKCPRAQLQIDLPQAPFEQVAMDILGLLPERGREISTS